MTERDLETTVQRVRGWIDAAGHVVVLTGGGISTDSGIPDFRGPQGVWTKNPEAEKQATIQHYVADKEVRKRAWQSRLETFGQRRAPNPGPPPLPPPARGRAAPGAGRAPGGGDRGAGPPPGAPVRGVRGRRADGAPVGAGQAR